MAEDDERYEWESNGGCDRCDALDGMWFDVPPPKQHPKCDCTVIDRTQSNRGCDSSDVRYHVAHEDNNHHGPYGPGDDFDMVFSYEIKCWGGGGTLVGEVVVTMTYGELENSENEDFFDDAYDEALQIVEDIAVSDCPVCGDHPAVA